MSRHTHARQGRQTRRPTGRLRPRAAGRAKPARASAKGKSAKGKKRARGGSRRSPTVGRAKSRLPWGRAPKKAGVRRSPTAAKDHRNRVPVVLAGLVAIVILVVGFPASTLLAQHGQLASASTQLTELQHQRRTLTEQVSQLSSNAEIARLAREDYQLIPPGQTLFDILPAGSATSTAPDGAAVGDPGDQPLVAPSDAPSMSPDPGLPSAVPASAPHEGSGGSTSSGTPTRAGTPGFWSRVADTLEFWK